VQETEHQHDLSAILLLGVTMETQPEADLLARYIEKKSGS